MKEKTIDLTPLPQAQPEGRRCCGRHRDERCSPEEQAAKVDPSTGKKRCCKGHAHNE